MHTQAWSYKGLVTLPRMLCTRESRPPRIKEEVNSSVAAIHFAGAPYTEPDKGTLDFNAQPDLVKLRRRFERFEHRERAAFLAVTISAAPPARWIGVRLDYR